MEKSNPTDQDFLDRYKRQFSDLRRALRRQYQEDFDAQFAGARQYADAAGDANHLDRDALVLLSMLLTHEVTLREHGRVIDDLEDEVETLRAAMNEQELQ